MAEKEEEMRPAAAGEDAAETSQPEKEGELYRSPNFEAEALLSQSARMYGPLYAYIMSYFLSVGIWLCDIGEYIFGILCACMFFMYLRIMYFFVIQKLNSSADILCCGSRWFFPAKNRGSSPGATFYDWSLPAFLKPVLQHTLGYRFWNAALLRDYHKTMAIAAAIRSGDVVLVRGEYLVNLSKDKKKLPRRQDLPIEATLYPPPFALKDLRNKQPTRRCCVNRKSCSCSKVMFDFWRIGFSLAFFSIVYFFLALDNSNIYFSSMDAIYADVPFLNTWFNISSSSSVKHIYFANAILGTGLLYFHVWLLPLQMIVETYNIVALSYMWMTPEHPDPNGEQLSFLASLIKSFEKEHGPSAFFIDYASLYQTPRTKAEEASFKRGLKKLVNLFYGSEKTHVWMNTVPPKSCDREYDVSGWCFTEKTISSVITPSEKLLDIGRILDPETNLPDASKVDLSKWSTVVKACTLGKREAPMPPDEFRYQIAPDNGKHFTSGADVEVVTQIFDRCYRLCIIHAKFLDFARLGWTDDDLVQLSKVMADCKRLVGLNLRGNPGITMAGLRLLLPYLSGARMLDIRGIAEGADAHNAVNVDEILRACPQLKHGVTLLTSITS